MNILLSEPARNAFFAHLVKQTVLERIRGGNSLCYEPPLQSATGGKRNTYTSLSSGNKLNPRGISIAPVDSKALHPLSPLFSSSPSDGSSFLSPTLYTHAAHGCWDELNTMEDNKQ